MADVSIAYKGNTIAELDGTGSKTLKTAGTYCEGDIAVSYAPRSRTYELTMAKASGWVLLTALDEDVLAHINDPGLTVLLIFADPYYYEFYGVGVVVASNTAVGMQGTYPVYGKAFRQSTETNNTQVFVYYPPNKTDTSTSLGGAMFRRDGNQFYVRPADGYVQTGTYRLTFTW